MPTTAHWPNDFIEMKQNRKGQTVYTFAPVELTIRRLFKPKLDGSKMQYSTGWSFAEDTTPNGEYTGVIWSHSGNWNGDINAFDGPYAGPTGEQGSKVSATLSLVEGEGRNFYNVQRISVIGGVSASQEDVLRAQLVTPAGDIPPAVINGPPGGGLDERIHKQVGFKAAVELLCAKMGAAKTAYDPFTEKEWKTLADDVWVSYQRLMIGQSPTSFMDEAVKAENGDTQIEDSEEVKFPPEEPELTDDVEDLPW